MSLRFHLVIALLLAGVVQAQVVDRMVAVVNKHVILESELDQATRVEFLLQAKPIEQLVPTDRLRISTARSSRCGLGRSSLYNS